MRWKGRSRWRRDLAAAEAACAASEPEIKMPFSRGLIPPTILQNNGPWLDASARVQKAQGDLRGAIAIHRRLLTPDTSSKWTIFLQPQYVLKVARLLEQSGETAARRKGGQPIGLARARS
jgi:hypothetical protein